MEALVPAVLEQKVVSLEAHRAWRILLTRFGGLAPGPAPPGMRVFLLPRVWARIPSWGMAPRRGWRSRPGPGPSAAPAASQGAWRRSSASAGRGRLLRRRSPGIGVWTAAEIMQRATGDPDAVSVGDYNLPKLVGWVLACCWVDDDGMLALLAPFTGHRYRVTRLLEFPWPPAAAPGPPHARPRLPRHLTAPDARRTRPRPAVVLFPFF